MASVLNQILDTCRDLGKADSFFSAGVAAGTVVALSQNEGDINTKLATALGRAKLCILVQIGSARCNTPNVRGVRTESWKYIHYPHGDGRPDRHLAELYNIEFDPEERHNLINNPKYTGVVAELKGELARLMAAAGLPEGADRMPVDEGIKSELPDQKIR